MASDQRHGLTLIELLFALFVVFVSVCSLAGVMVSTYSYLHRLQDRTTAVQLAQQVVRESLWSGSGGNFSVPGFNVNANWYGGFPQYSSAVYADMRAVDITVSMPEGSLWLERGLHDFGQGGIAVNNAGLVSYALYDTNAPTIRIWDDAAGAKLGLDYPKMPIRQWSEPGHIPIAPYPGGMAWNSNTDILYVCDIGDGGCFSIHSPATTRAWLGNPVGQSGKSICLDLTGNVVWGPDGAHSVWNDMAADMGTYAGVSLVPIIPLPPCLAIGSVQMITLDPRDGSFWVTDEKYMCIRHYLGGSANNWEPYEYKPSSGTRMGCPICLNMTSQGILVVVDGANIWQFAQPSNGVLTPSATLPLPAAVVGHIHASAWNGVYDGGDYVFFTDVIDHLYRYDIAANTISLRF